MNCVGVYSVVGPIQNLISYTDFMLSDNGMKLLPNNSEDENRN